MVFGCIIVIDNIEDEHYIEGNIKISIVTEKLSKD